jgi:hypothetical protein
MPRIGLRTGISRNEAPRQWIEILQRRAVRRPVQSGARQATECIDGFESDPARSEGDTPRLGISGRSGESGLIGLCSG